jgi:hypothetical protein
MTRMKPKITGYGFALMLARALSCSFRVIREIVVP